MKTCDSISYRAVDGDDGCHQNTSLLLESKDDDFPQCSQTDADSSYTAKSQVDAPVCTAQSDNFNFNNFVQSSQFTLALEILKWFQSEKLPVKPHMLNEQQVRKLKNVTKKQTSHDQVDATSDATTLVDTDLVDNEYHQLPPPRATTSAFSEQPTSDSSDKADQILQKLINKIESKYKAKKQPKHPAKKAYYYTQDTTSDSTLNTTAEPTNTSSEEQTFIKLIQKPHKRKTKKSVASPNCYKVLYEKPKTTQCIVSKKKEVTKIYIRDQAVQTETSETSKENIAEANKKKRCYFSDGGRPGSSSENDEDELNITQTLSQTHLPDDAISEVVQSPKTEITQTKSEADKEMKPNNFLWENRCNLAWYEPIDSRPNFRKIGCRKVESLQDLLIASKPDVVSRIKERQRLLSITSEERKLQEVWRADRQKLFGKSVRSRNFPRKSIPFPSTRPIQPKKRPPMTRSEMIKYSKERYASLPEVKEHKLALKRKQTYAANRENQKRFNKKVLNQVLKKQASY